MMFNCVGATRLTGDAVVSYAGRTLSRLLWITVIADSSRRDNELGFASDAPRA
jgi:hypothetical protein